MCVCKIDILVHAPWTILSMAPHFFLLFTLLTFSSSYYVISAAMNYEVIIEDPNHPGTVKFNEIIGGISYTKELMGKINDFIWSTIFKQTKPEERKRIDSVQLFIVNDSYGADVLPWDKNKINVSVEYLNDYKGDVKWQFTSLMYHQMTHVFQWHGRGKCPFALEEGIPDYTMLKANYSPPDFAKRGQGDKWNKGYDYTARFLEYCDEIAPDFVANLNKMMRRTYDIAFFKNLTGKPVDQLWKEYKAKYEQGAQKIQH